MTKNKTSPPIDWQRVATDVQVFARTMLGLELVAWQIEALNHATHTGDLFASCGRGAGKSVAAVVFLLWSAVRERGFMGLYLSGKHLLASHAGSVIKQFCARRPIEQAIKGWSDDRVVFDNGSMIYFLPHSEGSVRGWHNTHAPAGKKIAALVACCDEAEIVSEKIYSALLGCLTSSDDNRLMVLGSGGSKTHWWYSTWKAAHDDDDPTTLAMQVSTETLVKESFVSKKRLQQLKKSYPHESAYRAEVCGSFVDESAAFLPHDAIQRVVTDDVLPVAYSPSCYYTLGVDLSSSAATNRDTDRTAIVLLERLPPTAVGRERRYLSNRDKINRMLVDTGQALPYQVGLQEEPIERPTYRVAMIEHFGYLSSVDLQGVLRDIKNAYPGLKEIVVEKYEAESLDLIISGLIRRPDDPLSTGLQSGRRGKGRVDVNATVVPPTNDRQRECFSIVGRSIREGELLIPRNGPHAGSLISELENFGVSYTRKRGLLTFGAQKGHDDLVYALAWSVWGMRQAINVRQGWTEEMWDRFFSPEGQDAMARALGMGRRQRGQY